MTQTKRFGLPGVQMAITFHALNLIAYLEKPFEGPTIGEEGALRASSFSSACNIYVCMVITFSKSVDQPGKAANPTRDQLNREIDIFSVTVHA